MWRERDTHELPASTTRASRRARTPHHRISPGVSLGYTVSVRHSNFLLALRGAGAFEVHLEPLQIGFDSAPNHEHEQRARPRHLRGERCFYEPAVLVVCRSTCTGWSAASCADGAGRVTSPRRCARSTRGLDEVQTAMPAGAMLKLL